MPLQWLPYIIADWFCLDYRLFAAILLWLVNLSFFWHYLKNTNTLFSKIIVTCWPMIVWLTLLYNNDVEFAYMLESLIASYYLFAMLAINSKNKILIVIAFSLCLFSRYSIVLWIPLFFFQMLVNRKIKESLQIGISIIVVFFLVYWFPFLRHDNSIFMNAYHYHTGAALGEWNHLNTESNPEHLFNGLGFASWGYTYLPFKTVLERLHAYQNIHLLLSTCIIIIFITYYFMQRKSILTKPYLLMSFKIYIAVFYSFIQIPYQYLFIVPIIISSVLLAESYYYVKKAHETHQLVNAQ